MLLKSTLCLYNSILVTCWRKHQICLYNCFCVLYGARTKSGPLQILTFLTFSPKNHPPITPTKTNSVRWQISNQCNFKKKIHAQIIISFGGGNRGRVFFEIVVKNIKIWKRRTTFCPSTVRAEFTTDPCGLRPGRLRRRICLQLCTCVIFYKKSETRSRPIIL